MIKAKLFHRVTEEYFEIAKQRIENMVSQETLDV